LKNLRFEIIKLTENEIDFDLIGIDASIANALRCYILSVDAFEFVKCLFAFRRIMLAEVTTIAIENVWIAINSSIIQDEVNHIYYLELIQ